MSKPQVTKSWVISEFGKGQTVEQVLAKINANLEEGSKLSIAKLTEQCKAWGINLRKKPKPLTVNFVDDTVVNHAISETVATPQEPAIV